jgi:hypothetical protein
MGRLLKGKKGKKCNHWEPWSSDEGTDDEEHTSHPANHLHDDVLDCNSEDEDQDEDEDEDEDQGNEEEEEEEEEAATASQKQKRDNKKQKGPMCLCHRPASSKEFTVSARQ